MKIKHHFKTRAHNLMDLFIKRNGTPVTKISEFMYQLNTQARVNVERLNRDGYVGDGFEFFVELFLKLHPADINIGISDYEPIAGNVEDYGIDGFGLNINGNKCAIQIKYRNFNENNNYLTANRDHLSNMIANGTMVHNIPVGEKDNITYYIITTAKGLNQAVFDKMYGGKVKVIANKDFVYKIDGNLIFWRKVREIVQEILNENERLANEKNSF